jgi:hypothetical protein
MDDGKARIKAADLPHAIEAFQKANDIMHVPTTGMALAKAHLMAGHLVEARDAALEVTRSPREAGEPAVFDSARRQARELDAQLKPRIPMLRIRVHGGTPSRVAVDDVEIASSIIGEPVAVNPGKRVVTAKGADGVEVKGEIELAEREVREIELTLPGKGGDGGKAGGTPAPASTSGTSSASSPSKTDATPPAAGEPDRRDLVRTPVARGMLYGGAIAGAVGVAAGIVTGAFTLSKAHDVTPQCDNNVCAPSAKSDLDTALTFGTVSTIAFVVGVVGCGVAVVGYLLPLRPQGESRPPTMMFGPGFVTGTF